ncbi:MAG: LytR C-terminal domain-containing protein [Spirochaetes bacterium]|nr:LytR C-terminal domain-containing protein [Spirochaetota bacterium]
MLSKKGIFFIFLIICILFAGFIYQSKNSEKENAIDEFAAAGKMINIFLAASNTFNHNKHSFFAVLSINPENMRTGITFIPGEFEVDVDSDGNPVTLKDVNINDYDKVREYLSKSLKLNIPFYISFYSPDVIKFVDLIEGIDLYVLEKIDGIFGLKTGLNYLDGDKIMQYINNVKSGSVFEKYDRIQDIFLTIYYERHKYEKFVNRINIEILRKKIKTNILTNEFVSLASLAMKEGDLFCTVLPGKFSANGAYYMDEVAYQIYESKFLKNLVIEEEGEMNIKVRVMNATNIPNLARTARSRLIREGITVVEFSTSPYGEFDESVLINQNGDISDVQTVSDFTGIQKVYHITNSTELNDVLFILGKDYNK